MNVYLSPEAVRNLQEIRDKHLSLGYSNAAKNHLKAIRTSLDPLDLLETTPGIGISFEKKFNVPTDLQYLVSDSNYLIVYRVVGQIVEVLYIIDGRSNYLAWLFGI